MISPHGLTPLPDPMPDGCQVRSDPGLDRLPAKSPMSKRDVCRPGTPGLDKQKTAFSETMRKEVTRDKAKAMRITTEDSTHTTSSHNRQDEEVTSPLRLALARRTVKRQIFTYMDRGDKKIDIESRTGLSHQCIKWHRRLWRTECCHPRPRSKKLSKKSSSRVSQSSGLRSERVLRKLQACDGRDSDSSVVGDSGSEKRWRRKYHAMKQPKEDSPGTGTEVPEFVGGKCVETETMKGSSFFAAGKENIPAKDQAVVTSGELTVLPIRDLGRRGSR